MGTDPHGKGVILRGMALRGKGIPNFVEFRQEMREISAIENLCSLKSELKIKIKIKITRMWVNAQRDGRPADCKWRPLFNVAAKFG